MRIRGSSPRVRGTPGQQQHNSPIVRFIPACAGNTTNRLQKTARSPVHPRVCGEHDGVDPSGARAAGSSPRVRGTPPRCNCRWRRPRFIPACAGNATGCQSAPPRGTVHPRVCGERSHGSATGNAWRGSSPRVRGTQHPFCHDRLNQRFIPACAGNAAGSPTRSSAATVHPRVCGERLNHLVQGSAADGSSPRVRGTHGEGDWFGAIGRFIPACAGNASTGLTLPETRTVHPRVCGERRGGESRCGPVNGSSPRVRGTLGPQRTAVLVQRFIPACAGNAARAESKLQIIAVHPRVCGERQPQRLEDRNHGGSSPRVRGTLRCRRRAGFWGRFIPACAGNARRVGRRPAAATVHPRVCGERGAPMHVRISGNGSSPRVRGTPRE